MDFWAHQEDARRRTARLIAIYAALVIVLALLAGYAIDALWREFLWDYDSPGSDPSSWYDAFLDAPLYCGSLGLLALTGILCLFSPASLSSGGKSVAESLNGMLVARQTKDPDERRLLNVVEEMALASGMPVPPVYVLKDESGINAFAAGCTINDAVIGVTKGALAHLTRDELQAVIGHEFSHIRNGDMKLDLRFVQLLFGLMCLSDFCGAVLRGLSRGSSHSRSRDSNRGIAMQFVPVVLVVYITGLIMAFAGSIIQRAVNRQREFLADASSVQFTRNTALASALKKIGGLAQGSRLNNTAMTGNFRHLFFCSIHAGLFDSHPPLAMRIRRIDPQWDGKFTDPGESSFPQDMAADVGEARHDAAGTPGHRSTESEAATLLHGAGREPLDASHVALALLLDGKKDIQARQLGLLPDERARAAVLRFKQAFDALPGGSYLTLVEQSVPALKNLSASQFADFHGLLTAFIHADKKVTLKEWLLYQLIVRQVGAQYLPRPDRKRAGSRRIAEAAGTVLSALSVLTPGADAAKDAFDRGADLLNLPSSIAGNIGQQLDAGMAVLAAAPDREKAAFMRAAARVVTHDNLISPQETMFLRVLSLCLGIPAPLPAGDGSRDPDAPQPRADDAGDPWASFRSR